MPTLFIERARRIRKLVMDDRIGDALEAVYELAQETAPDEAARVPASIAAHTRLQRERTEGVVSDDAYGARRARLAHAVEAFLRDIERSHRGAVDITPRTASVNEAIFGTSHLRSVGWLRRGLEAARGVVRLTTAKPMPSGSVPV